MILTKNSDPSLYLPQTHTHTHIHLCTSSIERHLCIGEFPLRDERELLREGALARLSRAEK